MQSFWRALWLILFFYCTFRNILWQWTAWERYKKLSVNFTFGGITLKVAKVCFLKPRNFLSDVLLYGWKGRGRLSKQRNIKTICPTFVSFLMFIIFLALTDLPGRLQLWSVAMQTFVSFLMLIISLSSTDLLGRLQLWSVATQIIKLSSLPAVSELNQVNIALITHRTHKFVTGIWIPKSESPECHYRDLGVRFSKVPKAFWPRKAICKNMNNSFYF